MNRLQEVSRRLALASGSRIAAATRRGGPRRSRRDMFGKLIQRLRKHPDRYDS